MTPRQRHSAQILHDYCASQGASCTGRTGSGRAPDQHTKLLQAVHDLALGSGAARSLYRPGLKGKIGDYKPGQLYSASAAMVPDFERYKPGQYYAAFAGDAVSPELEEARQRAFEYAEARDARGGHRPQASK